MRTFYLRNAKGFPIACVATELVENTKVNVAMSVWNPKDKFSKKRATEIAVGRLEAGKYILTLPLTKGIKSEILAHIEATHPLKKVRDAAANWRKQGMTA